ncbi:MAG TPA: hypothetical protein VEA99_20840 [Gemmatimonadaceae bacterium]|nr:hypothetical protein [Gemmatimonadaceae bacterium]
MRPISGPALTPIFPARHDVREGRQQRGSVAQEISVRATADGGQIVVRRVTSDPGDGPARTLHIDAIVR